MKNPILRAEELNEILANENIIILDCSTESNKAGLESDFENIKIKGARYFDLKNDFSDFGSIFPNTLPNPEQFQFNARKLGVNDSSKIILYDNLGVYNSPRVWWMFKIMGHKDVSVLNGGLPEWIKRKFSTQQEYDLEYDEGNFKSDFKNNMISDLNFIKQNLENDEIIVIDARSSKRFNSLESEPRKNLRSGNIPNSINIPFEKVLNNGEFKESEDLELVFNNINETSKKLIFSCGSGVTACIVYLASELVLENEKSLYDGSWTEWGTLEKI